ncbi:hypothetical protein, partial [Aeromonas sp. PrichA-15]|uniref:hypothetical protein n=1 Tax=Aeromonas sp. PrichA-15 TaxID=2823360 RepID=UPI001B320DED
MAANMATILSLLVCGFIKNYLQPGYMARKNTLVGRVKQPFSVVFIRNKIYGNYFLLLLVRREIYPFQALLIKSVAGWPFPNPLIPLNSLAGEQAYQALSACSSPSRQPGFRPPGR